MGFRVAILSVIILLLLGTYPAASVEVREDWHVFIKAACEQAERGYFPHPSHSQIFYSSVSTVLTMANYSYVRQCLSTLRLCDTSYNYRYLMPTLLLCRRLTITIFLIYLFSTALVSLSIALPNPPPCEVNL